MNAKIAEGLNDAGKHYLADQMQIKYEMAHFWDIFRAKEKSIGNPEPSTDMRYAFEIGFINGQMNAYKG